MDEVTNENLMDEPTGSVDVSAAEGGEHTYDLNVILDPNLNETQVQTEKDAVVSQVERAGGEILEVDEWGNKRLAYEIRKGREGYYIIYNLRLPLEAPKVVENNLRLRDNVMRVLVTRNRPEWRTLKPREPRGRGERQGSERQGSGRQERQEAL